MKAISTGATARARDQCTNNFRPPASNIRPSYSKLWQVLRPGQLKLLPITHVYMHSMCMGNCGISWISQWRWQQWADGKRTLLSTYAFRDRYVTLPSLFFHHCNFIWRLPDVCCTTSSIGSTAVSHIALHAMRIHAYMES